MRVAAGTFDYHENNIYPRGQYSVRKSDPIHDTLDLTRNYWGTTDLDAIAEMIWDGNDDPDEPILEDPALAAITDWADVPIEHTTWSDVKARSR